MAINVDFRKLQISRKYTRADLARLWGYKSHEALVRGVVGPAGSPYLILFVTLNKAETQPQYRDELRGRTLIMEGENGHGSDDRLANCTLTGDEVHLFLRENARDAFVYRGQIRLVHHEFRRDEPSIFVFSLPKVS